MADLHETLEERERRSRLVSFLVGSAIILAIVVGVVWFNNRDDSGELVDEGVNITATEDTNDSDSGTDSAGDSSSDVDASVGNDDDTDSDDRSDATDSSDETDSIEDESDGDDQQAVASTGGADNGSELPSTGPEHAVVGLIGIAIAARLFVTTRSNLDNTLRS